MTPVSIWSRSRGVRREPTRSPLTGYRPHWKAKTRGKTSGRLRLVDVGCAARSSRVLRCTDQHRGARRIPDVGYASLVRFGDAARAVARGLPEIRARCE